MKKLLLLTVVLFQAVTLHAAIPLSLEAAAAERAEDTNDVALYRGMLGLPHFLTS